VVNALNGEIGLFKNPVGGRSSFEGGDFEKSQLEK
jgi:hypothetical protein